MIKIKFIPCGTFDTSTEEIINRELEFLCKNGYYIRDIRFCKSNMHSGLMVIYDTEESNG